MLRRVTTSYVIVSVSIIFFVAIFTILLQQGFFSGRLVWTPKPSITVAATIFPLYDIVRTIGGESVEVELLLPVGSSLSEVSSIYERPDIAAVSTIFAIGYGLDDKNVPVGLASKLYTVDRGVDVMLEEGTTGSPYYWLSIKNAPTIARNIAEKLIALDSAHTKSYEKRLQLYLAELESLDEKVRDILTPSLRKTLIVYGYDWQYFTRDYGIDIVMYVPADVPTLSQEISGEIGKAVSDYGLACAISDVYAPPLFFEPVLRDRRFTIINLDVVGGAEDRTRYVDLMEYNARMMFECLNL